MKEILTLKREGRKKTFQRKEDCVRNTQKQPRIEAAQQQQQNGKILWGKGGVNYLHHGEHFIMCMCIESPFIFFLVFSLFLWLTECLESRHYFSTNTFWIGEILNEWVDEWEWMNEWTTALFCMTPSPLDIWVTWAVGLHLVPSRLRMKVSRNWWLQSHPLLFPVPHPSCPISHQYQQSHLLNIAQIYYLFHRLAGSFISSHLDSAHRFLISFLFSSSLLRYELPEPRGHLATSLV